MLITVIIPVFNAEKYLLRSINSVLCQSYKNLEIILVNDGSTDKSESICKSFLEKDHRISYVEQVNRGPAAARNAGIKLAKGDYIGFVDSDDFVEQGMYKEMAEKSIVYNTDIVATNFKVFNRDGLCSIVRNVLPYEKVLGKEEIKEFLLKPYYFGQMGMIPVLWNKLYRKSFLIEHDLLIDEDRVRAEDYWFNFECFKKASRMYVSDKAYYQYVDNENSIMKTFRENQFDLYLDTLAKLEMENLNFGFVVNDEKFNKIFIDNTNEYIILVIKNWGMYNSYGFISKILKNAQFKERLKIVNSRKVHIWIINKMLIFKMYYMAFIGYYIWYAKTKY